jgi:hypothetical protein
MSVEEFNAFSWRRRCPQQGAEGATMHHAEANVLRRLKCQRVNIIPPNGWFAGWHPSIVGVARPQLPAFVFYQGRQSRMEAVSAMDSQYNPMPRLNSVVPARANKGMRYAQIGVQSRGCPRNCRRIADDHKSHWGWARSQGRWSEAMTREPGNLLPVMITRERVGRTGVVIGWRRLRLQFSL